MGWDGGGGGGAIITSPTYYLCSLILFYTLLAVLASALESLGRVQYELGSHDVAIKQYQRALAIR